MHPFSLLFLVGCWKEFDQLPQVDINKIPFENPQLQTDSVFVSILDSNLICPDGQAAPIFVVYPESEEALPVAVIFHSNPVAFITDFERSNAQLPDRLRVQIGLKINCGKHLVSQRTHKTSTKTTKDTCPQHSLMVVLYRYIQEIAGEISGIPIQRLFPMLSILQCL